MDWLAALAPLRVDVLGGDLRLFYLLWLMAVEAGSIEPNQAEPLPGIGPMTGALDAFARFFRLDADLVEAAAERPAGATAEDRLSPDVIRRSVAALPDRVKTALLARVLEGDPHVGNELRALVRDRQETSAARPADAPRSAGELRAPEAERKRRQAEEPRARRPARCDHAARRNRVARGGDRNRAPQRFRLRYGRRSSARPQGDCRGAGHDWRLRPPAAGDPRTA
ncbi:hypothetical protein MES4922_320035 [Mesorhizobium ventifaucium]|uniref:Uncharacterized protein n=1 Tax=Mesorhizobium ventifaucium TaxID=666020 RepID=A0ABM9E438_9HYPH|nr:hypothetical protein MES4922_320035 [Mesorhizobium ventifaucium]